MLHEPQRHHPLDQAATTWDETRARNAITDIARSVDTLIAQTTPWMPHPRDNEDFPSPDNAFYDLYMGIAGALWACHTLRQQDAAPIRSDLAPLMHQALDRCHLIWAPDPLPNSYFLGKAGLLLAARLVLDDPSRDDQLYTAIADNTDHPALEPCWGASGTALAAIAMHQLTAQPRWRDITRKSLDDLWSQLHHHPDYHCHLWTQDMYGHQVKHIGVGHGFFGNVAPMLQTLDWLPAERQTQLLQRIEQTLVATAMRDDDGATPLANWPQSVGTPRPGRTAPLVQWCHGAPGIILALRHLPTTTSPAIEDLLVAGGELTWRAGPLTKGSGLCHGTAGNGYALLALFHRTGDQRWLTRARHFAMHALEQVAAARREHGVPRATLWTGDLGVALFAWDCIHARAGFPTIDTW